MVESLREEGDLNVFRCRSVFDGAQMVGGDPFLLVGALPRGQRLVRVRWKKVAAQREEGRGGRGEVRGVKGRA